MKKILSVFLAAFLLLALSVTASADSLVHDPVHVTFTAGSEMVEDYTYTELWDAMSALRPGDDITVTIMLKNENAENVDWYMSNQVLASLEDNSLSANGGAYTYRLTYTSVDREQYILYASETVGGDTSAGELIGLHEATKGLEDYFYLETMATGEDGDITLYVALDGENQGNDYINTLADLRMNFAVEIGTKKPTRTPLANTTANENETGTSTTGNTTGTTTSTGTSTTGTSVSQLVKTGDDMDLFPYYILMFMSGYLLFLLAVDRYRRRKKGANKQ